jgi:hypothetical protein
MTTTAILLVSTFLIATTTVFAGNPATGGLKNPAVEGPWGQDAAGAASGATFTTIIVHFWNVLIQVGALAVLLYFLWGAIEWITSAGEKGKLESARNRMLHAALGLLILVSMLIIINFVSFLLFGAQFNILQPRFPTPGGSTAGA